MTKLDLDRRVHSILVVEFNQGALIHTANAGDAVDWQKRLKSLSANVRNEGS